MGANERRLDTLERRIYGVGADRAEINAPNGAVGALVDLAKDCGNAVNKKGDRIAPLMRRTQELDKYLVRQRHHLLLYIW